MGKAKAKRAATKIPASKWWAVTTDSDYTQIEANGLSVEEGVLTLHNGGNVLAAWNSWRKVERIDPPPPPAAIEAEPEGEPAVEGAEA